MHISKAQMLLEVLDTFLENSQEQQYVEVFRTETGQLVDEDGNTYDDEDLVPFDEVQKKMAGKKMPPWMMKNAKKNTQKPMAKRGR